MRDDLKGCYELLGLRLGASPEEVRHRFRELVLRCHPDRFAGDPARQRQAEEELRLVVEAHRRIVAGDGAASAGGRDPAARRSSTGSVLALWLGEWPNLLFIAVVATSLVLGAGSSGPPSQALRHVLEIVLVPLLFAIAWNMAERRRDTVRVLYIGFTLAAGLVALVDASLPAREREGGAQYGSSAGYSGEAGGSTFLPSGEDAPWSPPFPSGERNGIVPAPAAPRAPLVPAAPLVPVAGR